MLKSKIPAVDGLEDCKRQRISALVEQARTQVYDPSTAHYVIFCPWCLVENEFKITPLDLCSTVAPRVIELSTINLRREILAGIGQDYLQWVGTCPHCRHTIVTIPRWIIPWNRSHDQNKESAPAQCGQGAAAAGTAPDG